MSNAQTEARAIETQAWNCDEWPDWLHKIVDQTNETADRLDMSSEQAHAFAVLTALAAKDAELPAESAALRLAADRADRAEAQLAEARKALADIERFHRNSEYVLGAARRAREAQGGE